MFHLCNQTYSTAHCKCSLCAVPCSYEIHVWHYPMNTRRITQIIENPKVSIYSVSAQHSAKFGYLNPIIDQKKHAEKNPDRIFNLFYFSTALCKVWLSKANNND